MDPKQIVHSDLEILGGTPVFVGTRVPVDARRVGVPFRTVIFFGEQNLRSMLLLRGKDGGESRKPHLPLAQPATGSTNGQQSE
jgi:hypothetical protein